MTKTIEKIVEGFLILSIQSYETIANVHKMKNANASSVQNNLGGRLHGHLALNITPAVSNRILAIPYDITTGRVENLIIPSIAMGPQIASILLAYEYAVKYFINNDNTNKALKQQLVGSVEPIYLKAIHSKYVGFGTQTCLYMLAHIYNNYTAISAYYIHRNDQAMKNKYDPNLPIRNIFKKIDEPVEFASAGKNP